MEVKFLPKAIEHLEYWKKSGDKGVQKKIQSLIEDIQKTPFEGIGKPEALKYELSGSWSRRINNEHRIVYEIVNNVLETPSLRYYY